MGIRQWINDPGRAAYRGPTHQEVWNRENERFDKEASFIAQQNAESRNHEFNMAQQLHGFSIDTMKHMDQSGGVGEFHPNGMPSRYVPKSSGAFSEDGPSTPAPTPVAQSRNTAASEGVADVESKPSRSGLTAVVAGSPAAFGANPARDSWRPHVQTTGAAPKIGPTVQTTGPAPKLGPTVTTTGPVPTLGDLPRPTVSTTGPAPTLNSTPSPISSSPQFAHTSKPKASFGDLPV